MAETTDTVIPVRSYGCSYGCGRPYDFVVVNTQGETSTLFLCTPCYIESARDLLAVILEPDSPEVADALRNAPQIQTTPMGGRQPRYGHEAPANEEDLEIIDAYDGVMDEDELVDET